MFTVFWDSQGVLLAHFQKRGENMSSIRYGEVLLQLRDAIRRKLPDQLARGALLHHGNSRPHTVQVTQKRIQELQWGLFEYPPYSPEFVPSNFHLFHPLKKNTLAENVLLMMKRSK
jgi:hypothetical protein